MKSIISVLSFLCFVIFVHQSFSQQKNVIPKPADERYVVVTVEKLDKSTLPAGTKFDPSTQIIPSTATGDDHNYLLLDTQTGKTWILENITESWKSNGKLYQQSTFAWKPLFFYTDVNPPMPGIVTSRTPD